LFLSFEYLCFEFVSDFDIWISNLHSVYVFYGAQTPRKRVRRVSLAWIPVSSGVCAL
jgi:hypothetical protein